MILLFPLSFFCSLQFFVNKLFVIIFWNFRFQCCIHLAFPFILTVSSSLLQFSFDQLLILLIPFLSSVFVLLSLHCSLDRNALPKNSSWFLFSNIFLWFSFFHCLLFFLLITILVGKFFIIFLYNFRHRRCFPLASPFVFFTRPFLCLFLNSFSINFSSFLFYHFFF